MKYLYQNCFDKEPVEIIILGFRADLKTRVEIIRKSQFKSQNQAGFWINLDELKIINNEK